MENKEGACDAGTKFGAIDHGRSVTSSTQPTNMLLEELFEVGTNLIHSK